MSPGRETFIDRHGGWEVSAMVLTTRICGMVETHWWKRKMDKIIDPFLAPKQVLVSDIWITDTTKGMNKCLKIAWIQNEEK
jgi:hypothetical protein